VQAAVCITVKQPDGFLQSGRENQGAGFWIQCNDELFILTNEHVVKGRKGKLPDIRVLSHKGDNEPEIIEVKKIGSVPAFDIALLQPTNLSFRPPVCLSSTTSEALVQGAPVVVVGFPHGRYLFNAVRGSISSSTKCNDKGIIAVDANVNPGNSGGPVFIISKGVFAVAGMMTIKHGDMGIAIASPALRWAVNEILKGRQSAS
jgi:S1-C subfamily serine protease